MRADSLTSNFLNILEDEGLDKPIQSENVGLSMTPSPYARPEQETWSNIQSAWKLGPI